MLGVIIGDTVGSRYKWHNHRSKDFEFLTYKCGLTDDSIITLAIAKAILKAKGDWSDLSDLAIRYMPCTGHALQLKPQSQRSGCSLGFK